MRLIKHGNPAITIQPERTIQEKEDGTMSGSVVFEGGRELLDNTPGGGFFEENNPIFAAGTAVGSAHPDDQRLEMIDRTLTYLGLNKIRITGQYFGLVSPTTKRFISYTGAQNQDAIETHPNFPAFAGDADTPFNGAQFEVHENADGDEYEQFLGFYPFPNGGQYNGFTGVTSYLTAGTQVSVTYWTDRIPRLRNRMTIVQSIPGFVTPPDVGNFLYLDSPYRQVGSFYQVTEQYLGSGVAGWNGAIYRFYT